jgi:hypothetical protein
MQGRKRSPEVASMGVNSLRPSACWATGTKPLEIPLPITSATDTHGSEQGSIEHRTVFRFIPELTHPKQGEVATPVSARLPQGLLLLAFTP